MSFGAIALRRNGPKEKIDKDWFNALRAAGVLIESFLGSFIPETTADIINNVGLPVWIPGLTFDPTVVGGFTVDYRVYRKTTGAGAVELSEYGTLMGTYSPVAGIWEMTEMSVGDAGVVFTCAYDGKIGYISTEIFGTPSVSKITFKARTIGL